MFSTIVLYLVATFYSFNAEASNRIDYELHLIENAFSIDTILSSNEQKYLKISGIIFILMENRVNLIFLILL